jgi:hypothetical protein
MSSLLWVDDSHLEVTLLSLLFSVICYSHQREMISFIKLETCRLICCWLRWLLFRVLACFYLELGNMVGFAMVLLGLAFLWL